MVEIIGEKNLDFYDPTKELIQGKRPEPVSTLSK